MQKKTRKEKLKENSLAVKRPDLAAQWHPTKNGDLTPYDVAVNSHKKVIWLLPYDDPKTGHHDFEWLARIDDRNHGKGCPYLSGQRVFVGFNDLATLHPELASQWHPTKNGNLKPTDVTSGSGRKVWWYLLHEDHRTDKTFEFEWMATIGDRVMGDGCPYLSGHAVYPGFNDLATIAPELAKEWDYEKNKNLTPENVVCGSDKEVWWRCENNHSWKMAISKRYCSHAGCPYCAKELQTSFPEQAVYYYMKKLFPDACNGNKDIIGYELDIYIPSLKIAIEYDGSRWHQNITDDLRKNKKCRDAGIKMIRIREIGCPKMNSNDWCEVLEIVPGDKQALSRAINQIAIMLNKDISINVKQDMSKIQGLMSYAKKKDSLQVRYPEISKEWHPTKNGNLKPEHVAPKSNKRVWWLLPYDDPNTKKHFDFEWQAIVSDRVSGKGCPYISGHKIYHGFNDLSTLNPTLAAQWNYERNKGLSDKRNGDISTPDKIGPGSHRKVWWKCPNCNHEWEDSIEKRNLGRGCPVCSKKRKKKNT